MTKGRVGRAFALVVGIAALLAGSRVTRGESIVDLTTYGSSFTDEQGTQFLQANPHPTGTGVLKPFLRIQRTGMEHGFNTDYRPAPLDDKNDPWTKSLQKSELLTINRGGVDYYQFILDVNEQDTTAGSLLSLNKLQLFLTNSPSITGYSAASRITGSAGDNFYSGSTTLARKIYDLDKNVDRRLELDYSLNPGSGGGDLFVFFQKSLFAGPEQYIVLYSSFGSPNGAGAGFEEWAAVVPLPGSVLAGAVLIGLLMGARALTPQARLRLTLAGNP